MAKLAGVEGVQAGVFLLLPKILLQRKMYAFRHNGHVCSDAQCGSAGKCHGRGEEKEDHATMAGQQQIGAHVSVGTNDKMRFTTGKI